MSEQYIPIFSYSQQFDLWVAEYMPGCPTSKDDWGNVTKTIPELKPASYYNSYYGGLDASSAMFYFEADGKTKLNPPRPATEQEYRAAFASMNFYVNGGRTPAGRPFGIDPAILLGGQKLEREGFEDKVVVLPNGNVYDYAHAPSNSNDMRGENATYGVDDATVERIWTSDLYDGKQFNPNWHTMEGPWG